MRPPSSGPRKNLDKLLDANNQKHTQDILGSPLLLSNPTPSLALQQLAEHSDHHKQHKITQHLFLLFLLFLFYFLFYFILFYFSNHTSEQRLLFTCSRH
jgi:hypothetical protein